MRASNVAKVGSTTATVVISAILGYLFGKVLERATRETNQNVSVSRSSSLPEEECKRERLPGFIVLLRHGESEGNADQTLWREQPDNMLKLSDRGISQARAAGERLETFFKNNSSPKRVHLVVSPFERTIQTSACIRSYFEHRIVRTEIEPRIREQEFGNLQGDEFKDFRKQQKQVGRFWYRFPTGESGADVYDRVKSWWFESVLNVNSRVGFEQVDALVVVTHGLTMRFVLMQLFQWSPTTFHSVWNADNCDMYVLRKDLTKPGQSPYVLDSSCGDSPRSSVNVLATLKNGQNHQLVLEDYLSIPPPRTIQGEHVLGKLAQQYPAFDLSQVVHVSLDRTSLGLASTASATQRQLDSDAGHERNIRWAKKENSSRFPNINNNLVSS